MGAVMQRSRLAAYLDGALEPEEAASVVMHLADDPADRRYVEMLDGMNAMLAAAYARPLAEPMPDRIRRVVAPSTVVALRPRGWTRQMAGGVLAAAAGILLAVGLSSSGGGPAARGIPGVGPVATGSELHAALETMPSGTGVNFSGGDEVTLIASFLDGRDRPCREFELRDNANTGLSRGIACRATEGGWSIAVVVSEASGEGAAVPTAYVPASGAADAALSGALDALGAGMSLTPDVERALVASGWAPR